MLCGSYTESVGYNGMVGGTNMQEVPYVETPSSVNVCAPITINCSTCNSNPCNHTAACPTNTCASECPTPTIPSSYDPLNPYGDTCIRPRVFMNCKGEKSELIQIINTGQTRTYSTLLPLRMKTSQEISCDCPNLYVNTLDEGWIKGGFLFTTLDTCKVYLNYQGAMEDDNGNLLVPDHDLINEYYEYAFKARILENLLMNGEDVAQRMQIIEGRLKAARNQALSLVNTPNFSELEEIWWTNRRALHSKYYDMFTSHRPNNEHPRSFRNTRVI
jgi:hypothetical protein